MRILVIADIHANLHALEAVLKDAKDSYDVAWCLGDIVGYGPDPNECIQMVRGLPEFVCLSGNHDHATVGNMSLSTFNLIAYQALQWTQNAGMIFFGERKYKRCATKMMKSQGTSKK